MKVCLPVKYFFLNNPCVNVTGVCQTFLSTLIRVRWFLVVLCSLALFVVTEPPAHQLIDLKDQRRRRSDPLRMTVEVPLFWSLCRCVCWGTGGREGLDIKWNGPAQRISLRSNHYSVKLSYVKMKIWAQFLERSITLSSA